MDKLTLKGYVLENGAKMTRAIDGVVDKNGDLKGGVGDSASDEEKLGAYDRLGGLITYKGEKVKIGSFCDFKASKKASTPGNYVLVLHEDPKPMLEFKVKGEKVYVPVDKPIPMKVKVEKMADEQIKSRR